MEERVQAQKKYMESGQRESFTPDLYDDEHSQFTWVHLPATRIDWMEHLAQKIASEEEGVIHDKYSEIKSFLQGTWFQIPDQQARSRIMRPGIAKREFGHTSKPEDEIPDHREPKVDGPKSGQPEQVAIGDQGSITCSAIYMPFLSFSTHLAKHSPKEISKNPTAVEIKHPEALIEKFNAAENKYNKLMPVLKDHDDYTGHPVAHPVVHGCPTLDEAFYHFAIDQDSQDEKDNRNIGQVVSKQLKALEESEKKERDRHSGIFDLKDEQPNTQTILRVSQIWTWTIGDKWLISACSHPVDDVEELWIDGFIDHLQKDVRAKGALSQPRTANEMVRKMTTYCIGSYERRRTWHTLLRPFQQMTETQTGKISHGLSIRQLFWNHINQTGRKESSLFEQNHDLMKEYRDKNNKQLHTSGGQDLVESVKGAIITAQELFNEVKDIRDELGILQWIVTCQETVQKKLPKSNKDTSELTVKYVIGDIGRMEQLASRIQENTNSTLSLLQNEISTLEAEEALDQGRVFMVFTVLTIVFLPMSFLTSLFAMEADQLIFQPGWSFGAIFGSGVFVTILSIMFAWPWIADWSWSQLQKISAPLKKRLDSIHNHFNAGIDRARGTTTTVTHGSTTGIGGLTPRNRKQSKKSDRDLERGDES